MSLNNYLSFDNTRMRISVVLCLSFILLICFGYKFFHVQSDSINLIEVPDDLEESYLTHINFDSNKIFDLDLRYLLQPTKKCMNKNPLGVFIVTSNFGNVETRSAMRRTISGDGLEAVSLCRIFLLGVGADTAYVTQKSIENEAERFGDILQGNFQEAYRNLTYKHIMGLKWATEHYNSKFIIKMDDDIVVNMQRFIRFLKEFKMLSNTIAGYVLKSLIPKRDPINKWYVTRQEFKYDVYPTFVSGWLYITTPLTALKIITSHRNYNYFWIDDVFVTGILAQELRIKRIHLNKYFSEFSEYLTCCISDVRKYNYDCDILIGPNGGDPNLFYEFNNALSHCVEQKCIKRLSLLNETCVAVKKPILFRGDAIVEEYKLH